MTGFIICSNLFGDGIVNGSAVMSLLHSSRCLFLTDEDNGASVLCELIGETNVFVICGLLLSLT